MRREPKFRPGDESAAIPRDTLAAERWAAGPVAEVCTAIDDRGPAEPGEAAEVAEPHDRG